MSKKVKVKVFIKQSCLILCNPMGCGLAGSSVHGIFHGKNTGLGCHSLLWGSSLPKDQIHVSCNGGGFFTIWTTREPLGCSVAQSCPTLCNPMDCRITGFPVLHHLPKLAQTHVHWVRDVIQLSRPLLSPSPLAFYLFQHQGLFQWVSSSIRWPKYWSFSFSISPSSEYSGLISFGIDWFDFLAVQGTLKTFLQHHSSKASILWCSPFFMVQFSHPYMITGKIIALTIQTFVSKVISLLFNMLSSFVTAFLPKEQVSFNFMAAVTIHSDFGAQENKVCHCFHCFPIYSPWSDKTSCYDLCFLNV